MVRKDDETMNFIEAVKKLESGKKVFRLVREKGELHEYELKQSVFGHYYVSYGDYEDKIRKEDILSNDWKLFCPYTGSEAMGDVCKNFFEYYKQNSSFSKGFKEIKLVERKVTRIGEKPIYERFIHVTLAHGLLIKYEIDFGFLEPFLKDYSRVKDNYRTTFDRYGFERATYVVDRHLSERIVDFLRKGEEK